MMNTLPFLSLALLLFANCHFSGADFVLQCKNHTGCTCVLEDPWPEFSDNVIDISQAFDYPAVTSYEAMFADNRYTFTCFPSHCTTCGPNTAAVCLNGILSYGEADSVEWTVFSWSSFSVRYYSYNYKEKAYYSATISFNVVNETNFTPELHYLQEFENAVVLVANVPANKVYFPPSRTPTPRPSPSYPPRPAYCTITPLPSKSRPPYPLPSKSSSPVPPTTPPPTPPTPPPSVHCYTNSQLYLIIGVTSVVTITVFAIMVAIIVAIVTGKGRQNKKSPVVQFKYNEVLPEKN